MPQLSQSPPFPSLVRAAIVLLAVLVSAGPAAAAGAFNQFVGFGDSTLDSGYFRYTTTGNAAVDAALVAAVAHGAAGGFAGPGIMTSTLLAGRFGLGVEPSSLGGTNFANGSAYTAPLTASTTTAAIPGSLPGNVATTQQIANYLATTGGAANANALYVVNSGNNDLIFVQNQGAAWIAANPDFLRGVSAQLTIGVAALQAAGARTIMVPNTFYTAALAGPGGLVPAANLDNYLRAVGYGNLKWSDLTNAGVRFIPADLTSLFGFVTTNPALFGFTPASVLAANAPSSVSALTTSWANVTPLQLQTYLFLDGKHLTTAGQQIESDYETSLLVAPRLMALLPELAVQGGLARAASLQGQIELTSQHRGRAGVNVWIGGGASALTLQNDSGFPGLSGVPFAGSLGADYQTPGGLILGAAFSAGTQTQEFSLGGGHFDQNDQALSLYAAYQAGPVWGNAVASYGWLQDKIERDVTLGLFTDHNTATTQGNSLALALRAGGDIPLGPLTTGPVAGLVLQQVRINGFAETGTSGALTGANGVTALSYGQQLRDSAVSQLGWRVSATLADWRPFVEAKWNHELIDQGSRQVKAALTSATAAPYTLDAAPTATDWATGMVGTTYKINERVMVRGAASAMAFNPQTVSYGGELGLSVSF
ncbi:autotransporter domain-containing protein [Desulfovibrio aerotolerans]|uniref:Autotransporter domain-containing protein n=1 Tax=Solidesulfovibrio aerotolerans TaxID=295255 RepID=A0A7C9MFJ5_9BACT|nr:autotransporter domain-containing protein [Solidesulfovibrio aerotolerans]MYL83530.1 autotransporter domain-containing protein [Solidesulfovibrio aerotolerans]